MVYDGVAFGFNGCLLFPHNFDVGGAVLCVCVCVIVDIVDIHVYRGPMID